MERKKASSSAVVFSVRRGEPVYGSEEAVYRSEEAVYREKAYRCGGKAALFVLAAGGENVSSGRC